MIMNTSHYYIASVDAQPKRPRQKTLFCCHAWLRSPIATDAAVVAAFSWRELFSILWQSDGANK